MPNKFSLPDSDGDQRRIEPCSDCGALVPLALMLQHHAWHQRVLDDAVNAIATRIRK